MSSDKYLSVSLLKVKMHQLIITKYNFISRQWNFLTTIRFVWTGTILSKIDSQLWQLIFQLQDTFKSFFIIIFFLQLFHRAHSKFQNDFFFNYSNKNMPVLSVVLESFCENINISINDCLVTSEDWTQTTYRQQFLKLYRVVCFICVYSTSLCLQTSMVHHCSC